ncbi:uncharacterized protein EURHEDRAFT_253026 [Aspergillus ruber CBS 135680]|uniref:C2H2-type domain-containing protein n=1 Tax=Aspergillus ruber (strain CBS 135680) TaxID=1388766 RepID=A0A017S276_ASPRC|nr:uncharacterized protein EURHEDRAFT_253026 [Aspergillus ruber CBS 135680]EYE91133.1 hypothetical protein EURHEDRAFT_253026 [Aspergillus ruber CBS 135680]
MRQTSTTLEVPIPITYTPTTHRISKAKKGKRVHACQYPGCDKVFTRAEHRRRHELNHNPEALFRCTYPECQRAFHRQDLLNRHIERHELDAQMENAARWKQTQLPVAPQPHPSKNIMPTSFDSNMFLPTPQQSTSTSMSIETLVTPEIRLDLASDQSFNWDGLDFPLYPQQTSMLQSPMPELIDDNSSFYSYPESCASPSSSGGATFLSSRPSSSLSSTPATMMESYPETYPEPILDCGLTSSPLQLQADLRPLDFSGVDMSWSDIEPLSLDGDLASQVRHSFR